jgi:hypothetical protein
MDRHLAVGQTSYSRGRGGTYIQVFQAFFISLSSLSVGNSTVAYYSMELDGLTPNREVLLYCQKKIAFRD